MKGTNKYMGIAYIFAAYIGVGLLIGGWIDKKLSTDRPYFTASVPFILIVGYLVKLVIDLNKDV